jgi:hypothetical protein
MPLRTAEALPKLVRSSDAVRWFKQNPDAWDDRIILAENDEYTVEACKTEWDCELLGCVMHNCIGWHYPWVAANYGLILAIKEKKTLRPVGAILCREFMACENYIRKGELSHEKEIAAVPKLIPNRYQKTHGPYPKPYQYMFGSWEHPPLGLMVAVKDCIIDYNNRKWCILEASLRSDEARNKYGSDFFTDLLRPVFV